MSSGYARITGRIVGPEGLGRIGRVEFIPMERYRAVEESGTQAIIAHYAVGRLTPNGYLVDMNEERHLKIAAPASLPDGFKNYRVVIDVPGDFGGRREYFAKILAGTTVDLVDIIQGVEVSDLSAPPSQKPLVQLLPDGTLEATDVLDVVEIEDGILTWRRGLDG